MNGTTPGEAAGATATEREYRHLQRGALIVDRSNRSRLRFSGPKAAEALTGLVSNDIVALVPGAGHYAAALTPKGKVIADVRVFARADGFLVDTGAAAAPGWTATVRKYVNPRLAKYEDPGTQLGDLGVFGAASGAVLEACLGGTAPFTTLAPYGHVDVPFGDERIMVARVPDLGVEGFDVIASPTALAGLRTRLLAQGALESEGEALTATRIEAGRPEWGLDMDDSMLAQEVDMDRLDAISFTKGCYTGQETVARVHYRGHVNRQLRGLQLADPVIPPVGAELTTEDGKAAGVVRSGIISPARGPIALALVRREVDPGAAVRVAWSEGSVNAVVRSLPFGAG